MEKREKLAEWCNEHGCEGCVLHTSDHRCGRGPWFTTRFGKEYTMSDEEIDKAYKVVFENKKSAEEKCIITIEKGNIISAAIAVGMSDELRELIIHEPMFMLLLPIIRKENQNMIKNGEIVFPPGTKFVVEKVITQNSKQHFIIKVKED